MAAAWLPVSPVISQMSNKMRLGISLVLACLVPTNGKEFLALYVLN